MARVAKQVDCVDLSVVRLLRQRSPLGGGRKLLDHHKEVALGHGVRRRHERLAADQAIER